MAEACRRVRDQDVGAIRFQLMNVFSFSLQGDVPERATAREREIPVHVRDLKNALDDEVKFGEFLLRFPRIAPSRRIS